MPLALAFPDLAFVNGAGETGPLDGADDCERVGGNRAQKAACSVTRLLSPRDEIAGCIEKAYEKILFTEATRILFFTTPKKMTDYAKKVVGVQGCGGSRGYMC